MLEKDLEKRIVAWCKSHHCLCLKIMLDGGRGFPDRMIIMPGGHVCFVELKRPDGRGRISAQQKHWQHEIESRGICAFFCDNYIDFEERILRVWGEMP